MPNRGNSGGEIIVLPPIIVIGDEPRGPRHPNPGAGNRPGGGGNRPGNNPRGPGGGVGRPRSGAGPISGSPVTRPHSGGNSPIGSSLPVEPLNPSSIEAGSNHSNPAVNYTVSFGFGATAILGLVAFSFEIGTSFTKGPNGEYSQSIYGNIFSGGGVGFGIGSKGLGLGGSIAPPPSNGITGGPQVIAIVPGASIGITSDKSGKITGASGSPGAVGVGVAAGINFGFSHTSPAFKDVSIPSRYNRLP